MRLKNIDLYKGLLIILVVLGHILQGRLDENIWRTIIYSFHMPLFIGISGFLFNVDKVVKLSFSELVNKYFFRVILPWIIAVLIYFIPSLIWNRNQHIIGGLFMSFIRPYYHLWFVSGFLSWVLITWFLKKKKINDSSLLVVSLLISICFKLLQAYPEIFSGIGIITSGIKLILYTFRPYFYVFFVLGLIYRRGELEKPKIWEYLLPFICFNFVICLFYHPNNLLSILNFFIFNIFLVSLSLKISMNNLIRSNKLLEWIGINSLGIYLWHVLPILICKYFFGTKNLMLFYVITICMEIVFVVTYKYLVRISFFRKYLFGLNEVSRNHLF